MNRTEFWNIIHKAKEAKNVAEINKIIENELRQLPITELVSYSNNFYELFDKAYTWDLWNAAYVLLGGCGDDAFMDFRKSLISMGKETYENALINPDILTTVENLEDKLYNETFDYMIGNIYTEKTGKYIDDDPLYFIRDYQEPTGTKIEFEDQNVLAIITEKYPKITKKYW